MTAGRAPLHALAVRALGAAALWIIVLAAGAQAQPVAVRSGEHSDFTRLVVAVGPDSAWALGRTAGGYAVRIDGIRDGFDTARVFDLIPRRRVADIAGDGDTLALTLGCDCHALAFALPSGPVVIDIRDGPPPPGSPFEAPLDPPAAQPAVLPLPREAQRLAEDRQPYRELLWALGKEAAGQTAAPGPRRALVPPPPAVAAGGTSDGPAPVTETVPATPDPAPAPAAATVTAPDRPAPAPAAAISPPAVLPDTVPPDATLPDARILAAEQALILQLGRAATQGLVVPQLPPAPPAPSGGETDATTAAMPPDIAIDAETSYDRAVAGSADAPRPVTPDGEGCTPDDAVAVAEWGTDEPVAIQIADARQALVGEFDHPDPDAARALARLYVHFGMGAEAIATLDAFAVPGDDAAVLRDLSAIMDGMAAPPVVLAPRLAACDAPVALWSLLAAPELPAPADVETRAAMRAFGGLPLHLRRHLAETLADRLVALGDADTARAVRNSVARVEGAAEEVVAMLDARTEAAAGDTAAAAAGYERIIETDPQRAPDALAALLQLQLDTGTPVDPAMIDAAAAFAFEHQGSSLGREIERLRILALGQSGQVGAARDALAAATTSGALQDPAGATRDLLRIVAATALPSDAAALYFALGPDVAASDLAPEDRRSLARQILAAGLPDEAARLLAAAEATGAAEPADRLLRAEAELAAGRPAAALASLATLPGADPAPLRARALSSLADHAAAARVLETVGDGPGRAREELRARAPDRAARALEADDPALAAALRRLAGQPAAATPPDALGPEAAPSPDPLGPDAAPTPDPLAPAAAGESQPPPGPVAAAGALLDDSAGLRAAVARVLAAYPDPAAAPRSPPTEAETAGSASAEAVPAAPGG
jgi:hypothetical protein